MTTYSSYFDIDEDFYAAVDRKLIDEGKVDWHKFVPHKTFVKLLRDTYSVLTNQHLAIWVEGAYGTGKSYAVWTLEKLLTESESEIRGYFDRYNLDKDLCNKFINYRTQEQKLITVHRYGAQSILNEQDLVLAVQESIIESLKENGITYLGQSTLKDSVISWLSNRSNKAYFNTIITDEYPTDFGGDDVDSIIAKLNSYGDKDLIILMDKIFKVAKDKGITAMNPTKEELVVWIKDVIDKNNLKAIVFIWDEFTKYFANNMSDLTTFQMLAEMSSSQFYLLIVTHKSEGMFAENDNDRKIIDRFSRCLIELPDTMAFMLMAESMQKTKDAELLKEWNEITETLWDSTEESRHAVLRQLRKTDASFDENVIRKILPMHPYAALLLKHLSKQFASNQRSMFDFIKNDKGDDIHGFQWYIKNYGPEDDETLFTTDMLWNFFYENGKDQLSTDVKNILNHYNASQPKNLLEPQRRVLKTILLMTAISMTLADSVELFIPSAENIKYAFDGVDGLEGVSAVNAADSLVEQRILYMKKYNDNKLFYAPLMSAIDSSKKKDAEDKIDEQKTTSLVEFAGFNNDDSSRNPAYKLQFNEPQASRFSVNLFGIDALAQRIRSLRNNPLASGRIPVAMLFAKDEIELATIRKNINSYISGSDYDECNIVYIIADTILGTELYNKYKDNMSDSMTFQGNDDGSAKERKKEALNVLNNEWGTRIETGNFEVIWKQDDGEIKRDNIPNFDNLLTYLLQTVDKYYYPQGFEWKFNVNANLYKAAQLKQGVKSAVEGACVGTYRNSNANLKTENIIQDAWGTAEDFRYWEEYPHLHISVLKSAVETKMQSAFEQNGRISISEIYDIVKARPFGLMPNNITAFILGFILREYANDRYRYTDDQVHDVMNSEHLQYMIDEIIKEQTNHDKRYRDKYIVVMTPEEKEFDKVASVAFDIPLSDCSSIQNVRDKIRNKMKNLEFPIWILEYVLDKKKLHTDVDIVKKVIALFGDIANSKEESETGYAYEIGRISMENPALAEDLQQILTTENCRAGMTEYLHQYEGGKLEALARDINDQNQYINRVKQEVNSDAANWVWNKDTINECINTVINEYEIIKSTNDLFRVKKYNIEGTMNEWKSQCDRIRISYEAMKDVIQPSLEKVLKRLKDLKSMGQLLGSQMPLFHDELLNSVNDIDKFMSNQLEVFRKVSSYSLSGLNDSQIEEVFKKLNDVFTLSRSEYTQKVDNIIDAYKKSQEIEKLKKLWKERTASDSPRDWSQKNRVPFLAMVPLGEIPAAKSLVSCFFGSNVSDNNVKDAINYLERASFVANINDNVYQERALRECILKDYSELIENIDSIKNYLYDRNKDVYSWYGNMSIDNDVKQYAEHEYNLHGNSEVQDIVSKMSNDELKEYVLAMAKDNVKFGIQILKNRR